MKILTTKKDILWNYIGVFVSLAGNFLLIPFLLHFLTTDYYGLWNVFISLGAISTLFDFGFNSMFSRNVAYCWSGVKTLSKTDVIAAQKDEKVNYSLLKKVIKTCQIIYLIISLSALLVLVTFGSLYVLKVSTSISQKRIVLLAWLLFAFGIFLDLLYGYFDAFLRGIGEVATDNQARVISKIFQLIVTIVLLCFGVGIISTSIGNIIYGLIFRGICKNKFYSVNNLKEKLKQSGKVSKKDILEVFSIVWYNAWREGVVSVANYISNQVTTLLCSSYLGLNQTASFGLAVQGTSAIAQISSSLFSSYMPAMQEAYAHSDVKRIRGNISYSIGTYIILFPIGLICLLVIIPLINMVKGSDILNAWVVIGVGIYQYLLKYRDCYAWYLGATNRLIYYKAFIVSSILCIAFSVLFVHYIRLGIFGFIIAQIISQSIYNVWHWPYFVNRELSLTPSKMYNLFKKQFKVTLKGIF